MQHKQKVERKVKLLPQRVSAFLHDPAASRVVLLYGDDAGLIRERAEILVRAVAGSIDDPFLVAELARDEAERLPVEAASIAMTGGRRVVRMREIAESILSFVQNVLRSRATGLVVLEAPGMTGRSKLRALLDEAPDGVAIGCYPEEGRALQDTIRTKLKEDGTTIDSEALAWLVTQLGADRASTIMELEKLSLFAGPKGRVDLDAARVCIGDFAGLSLDDALFAATEGDVATTDRALELAFAEGVAPVAVLRAVLMHLQRLYRVGLLVDTGITAIEATRALRPPLFYKRTGAFVKALGLWSASELGAAMAGLSQVERNCKRTGVPDHTLSQNALLTIARRAAALEDRVG